MNTEKVFLTRLLFVLSSASLASAFNQVATFGTFGEGMLVHWRYPIPSTGYGSIELDIVEESDIALHIKPYYGSNILVLDSNINGVWDRQERPSNFPFLRGTTNDVTVYTAATGFDIYANSGAFHYRYNNRTDVTQISKLYYGYYGYSGTHQVSVGKVLPDFIYGKVVYISGRAPNTSTNFTIDLVQSPVRTYSDDKIHLRLKVQLETPQVVIRNSRAGSSWGAEERNGAMPFSPGQHFTVQIVAQLFGFEVAVNGNHFTTYLYRQPLSREMAVMLTDVPFIQKIEYF